MCIDLSQLVCIKENPMNIELCSKVYSVCFVFLAGPSTVVEDGVSLCRSCLETDPPRENGEVVSWVQCEYCERWFHSSCVDWEDEEDGDFYCTYCVE